jgi:hypothetical protein
VNDHGRLGASHAQLRPAAGHDGAQLRSVAFTPQQTQQYVTVRYYVRQLTIKIPIGIDNGLTAQP